MRLAKKKAKIVKSAIEAWIEEKVVSEDQGQMLLESYEVVGMVSGPITKARQSCWLDFFQCPLKPLKRTADRGIRHGVGQPEIPRCPETHTRHRQDELLL